MHVHVFLKEYKCLFTEKDCISQKQKKKPVSSTPPRRTRTSGHPSCCLISFIQQKEEEPSLYDVGKLPFGSC